MPGMLLTLIISRLKEIILTVKAGILYWHDRQRRNVHVLKKPSSIVTLVITLTQLSHNHMGY